MADSWQQIDDDGVMMDWGNIALCDLWHPLNAIVRSANERLSPFTGVPNPLSEIKRLAPIKDVIMGSYFYDSIHDRITLAISKYLNHTDHGGDWDGVIMENIPCWTEVTILAAIGDASRVVPENLNSLKGWIIQSHKILNMLRWVRNTGYTINNGFTKSAGGTTWAECATNYSSASWEISGDPQTYSRSENIENRASKDSQKSDCAISIDSGLPQASADCYHKAYKKEAPHGLFFPLYPFDTQFGYSENEHKLTDTIPERDLSEPVTIHSPVIEGTAAPGLNEGFAINLHPIIVVKFDGPNGFKFRDW